MEKEEERPSEELERKEEPLSSTEIEKIMEGK